MENSKYDIDELKDVNSKYDVSEIKALATKAVEEISKNITFKPLDPNKRILTPEDLKDSGIISEELYDFVKMLTTPIPVQCFDLYVEPAKRERDNKLMSDMSNIVFKEKVRKVFISQPFKDHTDGEIENEIARIKEVLSKFVCGEFEILPSFQPMPEGKNSLWCLGRSLQYLSEADIVFFSSEYLECYINSKGCMIENICNMIYNKDIITIYECSLRQYLYNIKQFEDFIDLDEEEFATNMSVINYDCGGKEYVIVRRINSEKII